MIGTSDNTSNDMQYWYDDYIGGGYFEAGYGYTCPRCGRWVGMNECHHCHSAPLYQYTWSLYHESKIEKAFTLLKSLVKESVIPEPKTYKDFCDLVEKIAKTI